MIEVSLSRRMVLHYAAATAGLAVIEGCNDGERGLSAGTGAVASASTEAVVLGPLGLAGRFVVGAHDVAITANGSDLFRASGEPTGPNGVNGPAGIAFTARGEAIIVERGANRLLVVDARGVRVIDSQGFLRPSDVYVNGDVIYVANTLAHRIDVLDATFAKVGSFGEGALNGPRAVTVTADGDIAVADAGNRRVVLFDRTGAMLTTFASPAMGSLTHARFADGALHVADAFTNLVHRVDLARSTLSSIAPTLPDGTAIRPRWLAAQPNGALVVVGEPLA